MPANRTKEQRAYLAALLRQVVEQKPKTVFKVQVSDEITGDIRAEVAEHLMELYDLYVDFLIERAIINAPMSEIRRLRSENRGG